MNKELLEALEQVEKEKNISKETLLEAIENSLLTACKNHFGKADNVKVNINPQTGDFSVYAEKEVVEKMDPQENDPLLQISLAEAKMMDPKYEVGDIVHVPIKSKEFGRIATQNAKNVILQKIREEERKVLYKEYFSMEKEVMTGTVTRFLGRNISINLGRVDAILNESEQVKGEVLSPTDRIKVYILEVKDTPKGPRVSVSRTHPDLVKRLFEEEVAEVKDGIVEIRAIAREAGSRTKIAVSSNDANVDPVGACVGVNGDEKEAQVIVPDYQLSLAIGKEGQNARLAARLTGYKIDIKSETQAREMGLFDELGLDDREEGAYEGYQDVDSYGGDSYGDEDPYDGPEDDDSYGGDYREDYEDDYQDQ